MRARVHEPGVAQDEQVLGDGGLAERERVDQALAAVSPKVEAVTARFK